LRERNSRLAVPRFEQTDSFQDPCVPILRR